MDARFSTRGWVRIDASSMYWNSTLFQNSESTDACGGSALACLYQ